jgi:hypothetical protein
MSHRQRPHESYKAYLVEKFPNVSVRDFIHRHPDMKTSVMFRGYSDRNEHLHVFIRVILDNQEVLEPMFDQVLRVTGPRPLSSGDESEFRFLLPSHKQLCSPYYVSFSPLGVLFFLFAWMQYIRPNLTKQYISKSEFECIRKHVDACRGDPDVLVRATQILNKAPSMDICHAIDEAVRSDENIDVTQISLKGGRRLHH